MSTLAMSRTGLSALVKIILFGRDSEFLTQDELTIVNGSSKLNNNKQTRINNKKNKPSPKKEEFYIEKLKHGMQNTRLKSL
jgi:hypothetical protein